MSFCSVFNSILYYLLDFLEDHDVLYLNRSCRQSLNYAICRFIVDKMALDHAKPLLYLDGSTLSLKSAQGNTVELAQHIIRLTKIDKLIILSTVESFALKAILPHISHCVV